MKQVTEIEQITPINELLKDSIVEEMIYYLYMKGIVIKNKDHTGVINAPISIFPSPIKKSFYNKIEFYQVAFNKLIDKMSRDVEFLKNTLDPYI